MRGCPHTLPSPFFGSGTLDSLFCGCLCSSWGLHPVPQLGDLLPVTLIHGSALAWPGAPQASPGATRSEWQCTWPHTGSLWVWVPSEVGPVRPGHSGRTWPVPWRLLGMTPVTRAASLTDKERLEEMLRAMKQKALSAALDSLRSSPRDRTVSLSGKPGGAGGRLSLPLWLRARCPAGSARSRARQPPWPVMPSRTFPRLPAPRVFSGHCATSCRPQGALSAFLPPCFPSFLPSLSYIPSFFLP